MDDELKHEIENLNSKLAGLDTRLTKIEEYIKCGEKTKEQDWKNGVDKKLEAIENNQKGTAWQWPTAFGVTYSWIGYNLVTSAQLNVTGIQHTINISIMILGFIMIINGIYTRMKTKSKSGI
jgi:hypothetical protein